MKKKLLLSLALFALATTISVAMNLGEITSTHSHSKECYDCSVNYVLTRSAHDRCPTCFTTYDHRGFCPKCDYVQCPICEEWTLIEELEYCVRCDDRIPATVCYMCGKPLKDCGCGN